MAQIWDALTHAVAEAEEPARHQLEALVGDAKCPMMVGLLAANESAKDFSQVLEEAQVHVSPIVFVAKIHAVGGDLAGEAREVGIYAGASHKWA